MSSAHRKAARVLPEPVGAWMSVFDPATIDVHPDDCAGVGASNTASNHALVAGEKRSSADTPAGYRSGVTGFP